MAISNITDLISGLQFSQPVYFHKYITSNEAAYVMDSPWYRQGTPGQAIADSPGVTGIALTSYSGQIPYWNAPSGKNTYLYSFAISTNQAGCYSLCDRLWHNSGIAVTTTGVQTINSNAWPNRCTSITGGNTPNVSGYLINVGLEASTATTNGAAVSTIKMTYTNYLGESGRIGRIESWPATAVAGTFVPFILDSGDRGVKSIQDITLGTSLGGGAVKLVAYRELTTSFTTLYTTSPVVLDPLLGQMPILFDNTVLFLVTLPAGTAANHCQGIINYVYG